MPDRNSQAKATDARMVMVEVFAYYKYEVTKFEAAMWTSVIAEHGDDAVVGFLREHVRTNEFAPKISDAQRMLNPFSGDEQAAFLRLLGEVRRCGPYVSPRFDEDPAIAAAVKYLGGWATLNAELPDPVARFEWEAYQRRFAAAYRIARSEQVMRPTPAASRIGLTGLHALSSPGSRARLSVQALDDSQCGQQPVEHSLNSPERPHV